MTEHPRWTFRGPAPTTARVVASLRHTSGLWDEDELTYAERAAAERERAEKGKKK